MAKRSAEYTEHELSNLKNGERSGSTAKLGEASAISKDGIGEFEDAFEDEIESEEDVVEAAEDGEAADGDVEDDEGLYVTFFCATL